MLLALKEKLQYMVEKILFMKEGEKNIQLYNLSQQIYFASEKIEKQLYWKQMLTLCQLFKMERAHLNHCIYKKVLMAARIPVIDHLCSRNRGKEETTRV